MYETGGLTCKTIRSVVHNLSLGVLDCFSLLMEIGTGEMRTIFSLSIPSLLSLLVSTPSPPPPTTQFLHGQLLKIPPSIHSFILKGTEMLAT